MALLNPLNLDNVPLALLLDALILVAIIEGWRRFKKDWNPKPRQGDQK